LGRPLGVGLLDEPLDGDALVSERLPREEIPVAGGRTLRLDPHRDQVAGFGRQCRRGPRRGLERAVDGVIARQTQQDRVVLPFPELVGGLHQRRAGISRGGLDEHVRAGGVVLDPISERRPGRDDYPIGEPRPVDGPGEQRFLAAERQELLRSVGTGRRIEPGPDPAGQHDRHEGPVHGTRLDRHGDRSIAAGARWNPPKEPLSPRLQRLKYQSAPSPVCLPPKNTRRRSP